MLISWGKKALKLLCQCLSQQGHCGDHLEEKGVKAGTAEGQQPEDSPGGPRGKGRRKLAPILLACKSHVLRILFSQCACETALKVVSFLNLLLAMAISLQKAVWPATRKHTVRASHKSSLLQAPRLAPLTTNGRECMCFTQMLSFTCGPLFQKKTPNPK